MALDNAMIAEGLKRFGYAPTPENVKRAQDMLASNPGMLDKLMGLQGGAGGESGADPSIMMSQLDKLAGTGSDSGITVGNGRADQPPLPQAPMPENTGGNSPAPVASIPRSSAPIMASGIDNTGGNAPMPASSPASVSMPQGPDINSIISGVSSPSGQSPNTPSFNMTYTIDPTGQISDEAIYAMGATAAGAATLRKMGIDYNKLNKPNMPQMSMSDVTPPVAGPRVANAADIGVADSTTKPKSGVEMTLDDIVEKTGPRNMQEKDLYPGQTPGDVQKLRDEVAAERKAAGIDDTGKSRGRKPVTGRQALEQALRAAGRVAR